jgi:transposase
MKGFLTTEQRQELLHELRIEPHAKYSDRLKTILLLDDGERYSDIAKFLFLDERTIRNYRKRYIEGGLFGIVTDIYSDKRSRLSDKQEELLSQHIRSHIY